MSRPKIQVFIATYNRPQMVGVAIDSVLSQSFKDLDVIVSDNSTNDQTQNKIEASYLSELTYIRRTPTLSPADHGNKILGEVDSDYYMIFHDDDIKTKITNKRRLF